MAAEGAAMGQAIAVRTDYTAGAVRQLAKREKDAAQARRLLAIAAVLDGASRIEAAKIGGMDRQTMRDWLSNILLLPLPRRASELNSQENIWRLMRQNWLSNRIFKSFDDIVDHCCYAWNTLIEQPWNIMSIAKPDWAAISQSL